MSNIGVYQIINILNEDKYIGSTSKRGFSKRWSIHKYLLNIGKHHSLYLQNAWNKYGKDNFRFDILLLCDKENVLLYEQIYFDYYKPRYNISLVAGSRLGVKAKESTRVKLSSIAKRRVGTRNPFYGRNHDSRTKAILSMKNKRFSGRFNPAAKLDEVQVLAIRMLLDMKKYTLQSIADRFSVSPTAIRGIRDNKTWKSLRLSNET